MRTTSFGALATGAVLQAALAAAQTSLYIPGFDPQPITADIEGVDAQGRTTWRLGPAGPSGVLEQPGGLVGSATLVADATEAHLVYALTGDVPVSLREDCVIADGIAACSGVASMAGTANSIFITETASPFEVEGAAASVTASASDSGPQPTASDSATQPTASGASATSGSGSSTPTAGSGLSSGPSATASGSGTASGASPSATGNNNGVGRMESSMAVVSLGLVGLLSAFLL
ncbi:hypothetical protein C2E23DRAFT_859723 [Lenzites betulinus]|nr:hypothetical protein C2E23DRAFT_859723 [Lenzites betulinus]